VPEYPTFLEGYNAGYAAGYDAGIRAGQTGLPIGALTPRLAKTERVLRKKKRKLSAWNKFVKANSKKPRFVYRSGKLNLKKMGVAFRKTPAGKKKK